MTFTKPSRRVVVVACVVSANLAIAGATWLLDQGCMRPAAHHAWQLRWWALAMMFGITEAVVLHVQVRRETQAISLSEIPLVLGLLYADPLTLLAARLIGSLVALAGYSRQPPLKLLYNLSMQAAEISVALAVFHLIAGPVDGMPPRSIPAIYLAVVAAAILSGWALRTVIGFTEQSASWRGYVYEVLDYPPIAVGVATLGFVAAYSLRAGLDSTWALLITLAGILGGYRLYGRLHRRHESLERLFRFTSRLPDATDRVGIEDHLLAEVRTLFKAEYAALVLSGDGYPVSQVWTDQEPGTAIRVDDRAAVALAVHQRMIAAGTPLRWAAATHNMPSNPPLPDSLRDFIVTPISEGGLVVGSLAVAQRVGDVQSFTADDLMLLQTVATNTGNLVRNVELVNRLRHDATHDSLTGLANRAEFDVVATTALRRALWSDGCTDAVIVIDLDGFKDVNDTLGHHHGDQILIEVARRLTSTVGPDRTVARFGGDEFAVFVPNASPDDAVEVGQAIVRAMQDPVTIGRIQLEVQASAGVALAPSHGIDLPTLLKRADLAMYASKGTSARATVFHDGLEAHGPNRLTLLADLRRALHDGAITVAVQPKAALVSGEVTGVEALARWEHPSQGTVSPDVFIPLAEQSGLIRELTAAILDQSLALCRRWIEKGLDLSVAVNLSPRALLDQDLLQTVASTLQRHRVPPRLLTLEITESSVITDPDLALAVLDKLRGLGVRLSVDDFGTGYSSLSYLKRLPVEEVKIDRSFIRNVTHDMDDEIIVRAVADLGRSLGLDVVAEGVEDIATWQRLHDLGCTTVQGYYLSRPLAPDQFLAWLRNHRADLASAARPTPGRWVTLDATAI